MSTFRKGEYGFTFRADAGREVSNVSSAAVLFKKPNSGTVVSKTATEGDSTRYWEYTMEDGVLDESGTWKFELQLTQTSGFVVGRRGTFEVEDVLEVAA